MEIIRPGADKRHKVEIYSETFARSAGEEYGLQEALRKAISNALSILNVNPMCCVVWRDGKFTRYGAGSPFCAFQLSNAGSCF